MSFLKKYLLHFNSSFKLNLTLKMIPAFFSVCNTLCLPSKNM